MSDEAIGWDDWGGEETPAATLLKPGDYTAEIKVAMWGKADWAMKKHPDSGGRILKVKVEIDAPAGYAEAWVDVPVVKAFRWKVRRICKAASVEPPAEGVMWSPACLVGRRVAVATSIFTNERTGESKVQVDKWYEGEDPKEAPPPAAAAAKKSRNAKNHGGDDDIPF